MRRHSRLNFSAQTFSTDSLEEWSGGEKRGTFDGAYIRITENGTLVGDQPTLVFSRSLRSEHFDRVWLITCRTDPMFDVRQCLAKQQYLLIIVSGANGDSVDISVGPPLEQHPGTEMALRLDNSPAVTSARGWRGAEAERLLMRIAGATRILARYNEWPSMKRVDSVIEGGGNRLAIEYMLYELQR